MKTYVDINFAITVRVPIDSEDLPKGVREGDDVNDLLSDDVWNEVVSQACDIMEDPGNSVDSIMVGELGDDDDEENEEDIYNKSPEYIHDAALDWMNEHADFLNDIGEGRFKSRCIDELRKEGYNVDEFDYVIDEAFEDMDWESLAADYDD